MTIPGNMLSAVTEMVDPNTSGWTTMLNCTIALGTGGRNGPGCLSVRSIAAGEVRARTVSSYPVVAGTTYQVFADAAGTVAERIGIRWLTSSNSEVSITWSLVTTAASATFHRVGVSAAAPFGATRAQVLLSSTPAAGAVSQLWENVYLGLPIRTTGNLLPFGTESFEISTAGWTTEANCALTRQAPAIQWAVDWYYSGGAVLAVTASANGNMAARTVDRPAVTPGVEYLAYCYLSPPTTGLDTWIELRFYDGSGTQLTATRSSLAAASTGYQRQRVSAPAPSTAATCGVAVGATSATAAQVLRVEQVVVTIAPPVQDGSVLPYADTSFEQGVAGWTRPSGVAVLTRSTPWGAFAVDGSYALTVTSATATASVIRSAKFPLPAGSDGLTWRLQLAEQVTGGGWTIARGVRWYDAANTDLGLTSAAALAAPTSGWWTLAYDATAPAGATQAAVELTLTATAVTSVIRLDTVSLWQALPLISAEVVIPAASVTLTLRELSVPDYLVRITRVTESGTRTLVRGPAGLYDGTLITSDLLVVEDYEAPIGVPFSYLVEIIDSLDMSTVSTRTSETIQIPIDNPSYCWLRDPGNPQRNVSIEAVTAPDWQRPARQALHAVAERRNLVTLSDVLGGLAGSLVLRTQSDAERKALHEILNSSNILLLQFSPGLGLDDMYVSVGEPVEARVNPWGGDPRRLWTLPLTEQDIPTTVGLNGSSGRTWQDVLTEFATWGDLLTAYATWEDLLFDRRKG